MPCTLLESEALYNRKRDGITSCLFYRGYLNIFKKNIIMCQTVFWLAEGTMCIWWINSYFVIASWHNRNVKAKMLSGQIFSLQRSKNSLQLNVRCFPWEIRNMFIPFPSYLYPSPPWLANSWMLSSPDRKELAEENKILPHFFQLRIS